MKIKRAIAIILTILLCFSLNACVKQSSTSKDNAGEKTSTSEQTSQDSTTKSEDNGKLFSEPFEVTMLYGDAAGWPYKDDWYVKKTVEEETGVTVEVILVDAAALNDRVKMYMASRDLPDFIAFIGSGGAAYGLQGDGPLVNISENLDKMPNFKKWHDSNPEKVNKYRLIDGNLYGLPRVGTGITNTRIYFYRDDILKKHNLEVPYTPQELYDVLKALKEAYPESYPLYIEYSHFAPAFDTASREYLDEKEQKLKFGPLDESFKELVLYLRKLYSEELMPPDTFSMSTKSWTDMMVQGKMLFTNHYIGRIEGLLSAGKELNPEYSLAYMPPINGKAAFSPTEYDIVTVTKVGRSEEKIEKLLKFQDWFYSDEAYELLSWGKEGVTYKVVDGKKQFIDTNYRAAYGIATRGWFGLIDQEAVMSTYPEVVKEAIKIQPQYELPENPRLYMPLSEQETEIHATIGNSITKYVSEQVALFVIGEKSLDEWDNFIETMKSMGVDQLMEAYNTAYDRLIGRK